MPIQLNSTTYKEVGKSNPKDLVEVVIGDDKQADFFPQIKVQRWDNEVNCSIRLIADEKTPTVSVTDKIQWMGDKTEAHFYPVTEGEGGYEFEVILKEKPATNVMEFTLEDKGVEYFYQPELTEEEIKQGASRPENVVGSYAVYAKTPKTNWTGGKEYKCGKVGHIFRPKIIDSKGTEVWGELNIDTEKGILSVTIPQDFLDKAVYPVIVDPTFGYNPEGQGGSQTGVTADFFRAASGIPASSGTVDSISAYVVTGGNNRNFAGAIYTDLTTNLDPDTGAGVATSSAGWRVASFTGGPSVVGSTEHWVGAVFDCGSGADQLKLYFDFTSGDADESFANNSATYPTLPVSGNANNDDTFSIYATYTAGGSNPRNTASNRGTASNRQLISNRSNSTNRVSV